MLEEFYNSMTDQLSQKGYQLDPHPNIPGVNSILYAKALNKVAAGFTKMINYYLFVDWEYDLLSQSDQLKLAYKRFSSIVNMDFKVPHGWRMTIPNIVVIAVCTTQFDQKAINHVLHNYQSPFIGGEVGQTVLFDLQKKEMYSFFPYRYRQPGSIPLGYASNELWQMFNQYLPEARNIQNK
jgi:hypothetical protein